MDSAAPDDGELAGAGGGGGVGEGRAASHAGARTHHGQQHGGGGGGARPASPAPGQQQAARAWNKIVRAVLRSESEGQTQAEMAAQQHSPAMAQVVWSTMHSGAGHARSRSGSLAGRTQQNLLQLARSESLRTPQGTAAAPWHAVTFHHDESESLEGSEVRGTDEERKSKDGGTPPFVASRPPALPLPIWPLHQQQRNAVTPGAAGSSTVSAGNAVAPSAGTPVAAVARRPSFSAASPSHILRKHDPAPLAALNFLPGGLNAATALEQYPSLTPADLEDIGSFLDANADDRWNYSSLFSWSEPKLHLLLQAIQPEHLTLIAHRSMREHVTSRPIDIAFRNLWYQVEERGQMVAKLRGLSGYCKPGMMVCVWGAADSGVSTFLALLAGCFQRASSSQVTGELLLNGQPLLRQPSALQSARPQLGYVTREAENFALLTVGQTIYFSARLRLPKLPETILRFRVGLVCKLLGLSHLQDSIVGSATVRGLSGGERRRLGYACELVVGYSLILCDQPTDGLDQPTALALMQNFKLTCGAGRSMMTSLASASAELFELFDFILLMSKGACIYFGPRRCVLEYLASQGFEPPRADEIVAPSGGGGGAMADGDYDLESGPESAPSLLLAVPDFLQSLSATPERFWRARLPIVIRDRPVPWLSEAFPFFSNAAAISKPSKEKEKRDAAKYLIEVDVRRLTRMDSDHPDSPQLPMRHLSAAAAAAGTEMTPLKRQLSSHALSLDAPAAASAAPSSALVVSQPTRRRAWKRLLKGWRASDLNADLAYVLDFDLQPIQPTLIAQTGTKGLVAAATAVGNVPPTASHLPRKSSFLPERPSFLAQLWLCLWRQSSFVYRNRGLWLYNYLKTLVLALVMGTLFFQLGRDSQRDVRPRFGAIYFAITFYGNAAIQMISVLLSSRSIVMWESFAGYYHSMAYSLALTLVFIPVALVEMLIFSLVFYPLAGFAGGVASVSFVYFWMVFTLSNLAGRGWILLFTTFLPTQSLANIAAPVFNLLVSSFCGYLHPASSIPAAWKWMYYLSYYTYAFRGLSMNEFEALSFECPEGGGGGGGQSRCAVVTGADALSLYDINFSDPSTQKWRDLLILFAFWVAFQSLAALALLTRHYQPRGEAIQPDFGDHAANAAAGTDKGEKALAAGKGAASVPEQAPLLLGPSAAAAAARLLPGRAGSPDQSPAPRHVLSFLHLSYSVPLPPPRSGAPADAPREKLLLDDMCGVVRVGQLVALIGTSGAGKCWGWNTKLMMHDGRSKLVQDIVAGDRLMGDDGTARTVLEGSVHVGHTQNDPTGAAMYEVTSDLAGRNTWTCNGDHILVLKFNERPGKVLKQSAHALPFFYSALTVDLNNVVVEQSCSFTTEAEATAARDHADASWAPLVWEGDVNTFLRFSDAVQKRARMFQPDHVRFQRAAGDMSLRRVLTKIWAEDDAREHAHRVAAAADAGVEPPPPSPERVASREQAELLAWVIGIWLADGSAGVKDNVNRSDHSHMAIVEQLKLASEVLHGPVSSKDEMTTEGGEAGSFGSVLMRVLQHYKMFDAKHIPHHLLSERTEVRMQLLAGILDGAGSVDCSNRSVEVPAMDGLDPLARGLGFSTCNPGEKECAGNTGVVKRGAWIRISGEDLHKIQTVLMHKRVPLAAARNRELSQDERCAGFRITQIPHAHYWGFTLDGNGRCLLVDFVVTHNSTLLDVLAKKKTSGRISGSIQWDGRPLPAHFERRLGYVEQFDSLAPNSTVQESLFFAGRLRLPVTLSDAEITARVDRLLHTLELEPMRSSLIGSAENGNLLPPEIRKKVSIGIELMNDPLLLFLDEPTTGLNSIEALLIARLLKRLSRRLVIIATIHQPNNAVVAHFDALLVVKPPGQLAFFGSFPSAARFFHDLPAHYPSQLADVHFPALQPHDNLADVVLGALKTVAKREGDAKQRNVAAAGGDSGGSGSEEARLRSFHCREAFLQSPYAVPLLRALAQQHGKDEVAQFVAGHGVVDPATLLEGPLPAAATAGWSFDPASLVTNDSAPKSAAPSPSSSPPTASSGALASAEPPHASALLYWYRFRELFRRFVLSTLRAKRQFRLRFFTCCFYGFVTGTLFWQLGLDQKSAVSRLSFLYFTARFSLFSGNLKLPGVFGVRVMTARESGAGMYSQGLYALVRSVADLPWVMLEMFCFTTIVYWSAGMSSAHQGSLYAWSLFVLTLDRLISIGFIELVGALSSSIEVAQSVQTGANMLFMLFSGFFIAPSAIPQGWKWMQYLSPYFYVLRFLAANEYATHDRFTCDPGQRVQFEAGYTACPMSAEMDQLGTKCPLQCGAEVLAIYSIPGDVSSGRHYTDLGIVVLFALAYPILAAMALRSVNWIRR